MAETVRQCSLYRDVLKSPAGYWMHIIGEGEAQDLGAWSTGNGWAAYGMLRVLHTLQGWSETADMNEEAKLLKEWIKEILDGAIDSNSGGDLLKNYLNDQNSFGEIAGTAVLSAVAYRMAINDSKIFPRKYVDWADTNRRTLAKMVSC